MSMTKKNYELLAVILSYTDIKNVEAITLLLQNDNEKFDKIKFWQAVLDYQNGVRVYKD